MQTPERTPSPVNPHDEFLEFPAPQVLPFPPGTYTLLPLVDKADNGVIPRGPWEAIDLKKRWEQHIEKEDAKSASSLPDSVEAAFDSSAVEDDDDDEDGHTQNQARAATDEQLDRDFIVPFFVKLPRYVPAALPVQATTPRRRSSSTRSSSFTPMTSIPAVRPATPSPSLAQQPTQNREPSSPAPSQPVGFLRPSVVLALLEDNQKLVDMNLQPVWKFLPPVSYEKKERRPSYGSRPGSRRHSIKSLTPKPEISTPLTDEPISLSNHDNGSHATLPYSEIVQSLRSLELGRVSTARDSGSRGIWAVGFEDWINESDQAFGLRNEHLDRLVRGWKMAGKFLDQLAGWRDEVYNIYGPAPGFNAAENPLPGSNVAFTLERAACSLFGVTTFGVHCTAYVEDEGETKIWVPRRSATKSTWPSFLDNTVAGGITAGDLPRQSILREFSEEASLAPHTISPLLRQTGVITYVYRTPLGWLQPETQYIYDIKLPSDGSIKPSTNPSDGEVESFELMGLQEVVERMVNGEFKANCALVLIDFFIRHGFLTAENDVRFLEVSARIHRELGLPGPV